MSKARIGGNSVGSIHDGHRERMKERFKDYGLQSFSELNALELLLFYAIPRRDTNELAHALIMRFGSLAGVFAAGLRELCEVPGVGESTAQLIMLVPQIMKLSLVGKANEIKYITNSDEAGRYLVPRFVLEREEVLLLVSLDSQKRVIACNEMGRGVVNSVLTSNRRIVETALKNRASSVIIAHNHPDGFAIPSREDDAATQQIKSSLSTVGIPLVDHIVVAGDDFVSYADSGMLLMYK